MLQELIMNDQGATIHFNKIMRVERLDDNPDMRQQ